MSNKTQAAKELGVSRSSLYYHPKLPEKDDELRIRIEELMLNNPGYGHRRVALALKINHKRASRVMRKFNLKPARRCKSPRKESAPEADFPNVMKLICPIAPNIVWVADFTFIPFQGQFIYLATVMDLHTREILGFAIKTRHDTMLIMEAFDMALATAATTPEWFHNDRGSEYRSAGFEKLLLSLNIRISISPKPWFNPHEESSFGRFKTEFGDFDRFETLPELVEAICLHVHYYNNFRIHTKLKRSPVEFKTNYYQNQKNLALPLGEDGNDTYRLITESLSKERGT